MDVAGAEPVRDGAARFVQGDAARLKGPATRERPGVQREPLRHRVGTRRVQLRPFGGGEAVRALVPQVRLGRPERAPVGPSLVALALDGDEVAGYVARPGVGQQLLDHLLRALVLALTEMVMTDRALGVREEERRAVVVAERGPHGVLAVDGHGIVDPALLDHRADAVDVPLERELGRVHADHHEPVLTVLPPTPDIRGRRSQLMQVYVQTSTSDDLAAQVVGRQRWRVEPIVRTSQGWEVPLGRWGDPVSEHLTMVPEPQPPRTLVHRALVC